VEASAGTTGMIITERGGRRLGLVAHYEVAGRDGLAAGKHTIKDELRL